jgi:hypothetical protein
MLLVLDEDQAHVVVLGGRLDVSDGQRHAAILDLTCSTVGRATLALHLTSQDGLSLR